MSLNESATMPYNTRRKSLSLPSLGIQLPQSHASRAAARLSPPSTDTETPSKKMKRSHEDATSMSPPPKRASISNIKYENTPPPSPEAVGDDSDDEVTPRTIDLDAVNDEIVEGVILQLQKTGNKPHLVKELATVLSQTVKIVEQSANPSAIISSRLSTYLKRTWTASSPCPIAKELETVHPRRTFFYLTTCPPRGMPEPSPIHYAQRAVITPSISSAASRSDEAENERRRELSPSPEVDLSSPEFDDEDMSLPNTTATSFASRRPANSRSHRASSPPLEKDEKEFTQTARGMQKRKLSRDDTQMTGVPSQLDGQPTKSNDNEIFFPDGRNLTVAQTAVFLSSPAMKPSASTNTKRGFEESLDVWNSIENGMDWDTRSPEHVELSELDDLMFDF